MFENELMDLSVNIPLEKALDTCWDILARCFERTEVGIKTSLVDQFWPNGGSSKKTEPAAPAEPDKPAGPTEPAAPDKPAKPAEPAEPAEPAAENKE
jgi:V/A-type H+-transporting ATPase subunit B